MLNFLVTRPAPEAKELAMLLNNAGHYASVLPLLDIIYPEKGALIPALRQISPGATLIFVSRHAVEGLYHGASLSVIRPFYDRTVYAIGQGTAGYLSRKGFKHVCFPPEANSEGLIRLLQQQRQIPGEFFIVRGKEGREYLQEQLCQQGAQVTYLCAYMTKLPDHARARLEKLMKERAFDVVVTTSLAGLKNFFAVLPQNKVFSLPYFTVMPGNMLNFAKEKALKTIVLKSGDNAGIFQQLKECAHE